MSLKSRLGFSPFRRSAEQPKEQARDQISEFHAEYADFCAGINPHSSFAWRARGFEDFPRLCAVDGVASVGVSQELHPRLHILTTCIIAPDVHNRLHEIGEIIVTFDSKEKKVTYENVTHPMREKDGGTVYAHPHVFNGTLCSSGRDAILEHMLNADVSSAMTKILINLRMRNAYVTVGNPYCTIDHWPVIGKGE